MRTVPLQTRSAGLLHRHQKEGQLLSLVVMKVRVQSIPCSRTHMAADEGEEAY
jgi:hypothetical protein